MLDFGSHLEDPCLDSRPSRRLLVLEVQQSLCPEFEVDAILKLKLIILMQQGITELGGSAP